MIALFRGVLLVATVSTVTLAILSCETIPTCVGELSAPLEKVLVTITVRDEMGAPLGGVTVDTGTSSVVTQNDGTAIVNVDAPILAMVSKEGFLSEPVPITTNDTSTNVRLLSDKGGTRFVIHSVGDVMFGRRYEDPTDGDPLIPRNDVAAGARRVVSQVKRMYSAADLRTLNLETVMSDRSENDKYPGKRFILRSRPGSAAGVQALEASVVILANNHSRDYKDEGIADTISALTSAGIPFTGATVDDSISPPFVTTVRNMQIGLLAWTTVDGSFVNDSYPPQDEREPSGLDDSQRWQYENRTWGFSGMSFVVPSAMRRIRSAWNIFADEEGGLTTSDLNNGWASVSSVYPELQDWVARRGHGGAAFWTREEATARIAELASQTDLVIVQLHAGFQFQEAPSSNVQLNARTAIDAGADLVVCHHPHVLQGFEWYKGKLIAYSLGNFVFDQDFLSTFSSSMLRTVWEGTTMIEARAIPVEIDAYRPVPSTDDAAKQTLYRLWERSVLRAASDRTSEGKIRANAAVLPTDSREAHFVLEHHTARIVSEAPATQTISMEVDGSSTARIPFDGLIDPRLGLMESGSGILVGRDTFGWGRFEDETADDSQRMDTHWNVQSCDKDVIVGDAATGHGFLRLRRYSSSKLQIIARPVARIPFFRHRIYENSNLTARALDPDPTYTFRFAARSTGSAEVVVRLDLYHFDDTNPTEDPESELVKTLEFPATVSPEAGWQTISFDISPFDLGSTDAEANMVLLYFQLKPGASVLDVDDVSLVEWRSAETMHDRFGRYDFVRNDSTSQRTLAFEGLPFIR